MPVHEGSPFTVQQVAQCYRRFLLIEATAQGRVLRPLLSMPAYADDSILYENVGSKENATCGSDVCQ